MKSKTIVLIALLSVNLFSYSQENIMELSLTAHNGYGPFDMKFGGMKMMVMEGFLEKSKIPEDFSVILFGIIETNDYQNVYQKYISGRITKDKYEEYQKAWNWIPDTLNLSKTPLKTQILFAYGEDTEGNIKIVVDANNNLDLRDDKLFIPIEEEVFNTVEGAKLDSLVHNYSVDVFFETYINNNIVPVNVPFLVYCHKEETAISFMYNFSQYSTTQFKGEEIAVCSNDFTFNNKSIRVARVTDLKDGEKANKEEIFINSEYIQIKDEVFKILGVNTVRNTLVLERIDLSQMPSFYTQVGFKAYPFQGEEFTTGKNISLDALKGKYVLLDFWASWCGPCIKEFPTYKELYSKTDRSKFEIIGIAGGNTTPDALKKLIDQHEIDWLQILSDETVKTYGISSYPTILILDTEGKIISKDLRGRELEEKILSLLKE